MKQTSVQKPLVQSVERALDILELIGNEEKPLRSSFIAENLELHSSTANNLIRTLYRRGFLTQRENGKYYIGLQCYRLGKLCDQWDILRTVAKIHLEELADSTGDNAIIATESGGKLVEIADATGSGDIIVAKHHPSKEHLYCTSIGKILMAYADEEFLIQYQTNVELKKYTDCTITDWEKLLEQFAEIRKTNVAYNYCESRSEVAALSVPILDSNGRIICALGQSFPSFFIDSGRIDREQRITKLQETAGNIRRDYELHLEKSGEEND